jgi:predicted ArsR family transcriptional regulator
VIDQPTLPFENRLGPSHHNAPETSGQAAVANFPRSGTQRVRVLLALYSADLTDDEIAHDTRLVGNSVRPRRGELVADGLVEDSGKRASSNFGHPAVVWTLTEDGLRAAKELTDG